ncbi:phosphatase PAP2 family protein [Afifella sp. JA880]|uniref:phosphatase PAP2 family protein n=1 Tax=Afifella sp. JA880 TaxID=2975280 RepID=UPI0021BBB4B5|nr:phosphatase PAP2 family protein [Afifella sp. JA880]MCT8266904.1 phosphatase PAP2 family protein [Afifella sp. JA880]
MAFPEQLLSMTRRTIHHVRHHWARQEFLLLLLIGLGAGSVWGFIALADEVVEGETHAFDMFIMLAMRNPADHADPLGPLWFEETMRDITSFGSTFGLVFVSLTVIFWLVLTKRPHAGLLVFASLAGGAIVVNALKYGFSRPRPDLVAHSAEVFTTSFPSAHAAMSATVYLTLGALVMRFSKGRALKLYALFVAVLLTILVGLSRVYLGVHWPTDVLAGWAIGAAWATFVWVVALWLQRRGRIEPSGVQSEEAVAPAAKE